MCKYSSTFCTQNVSIAVLGKNEKLKMFDDDLVQPYVSSPYLVVFTVCVLYFVYCLCSLFINCLVVNCGCSAFVYCLYPVFSFGVVLFLSVYSLML